MSKKTYDIPNTILRGDSNKTKPLITCVPFDGPYRRKVIESSKAWDRTLFTNVNRLSKFAYLCKTEPVIVALSRPEKDNPSYQMPNYQPDIMGYLLYRKSMMWVPSLNKNFPIAEIVSLAVNHDERRQGIATSLVNWLSGFESNMTVTATVPFDCLDALLFFKKHSKDMNMVRCVTERESPKGESGPFDMPKEKGRQPGSTTLSRGKPKGYSDGTEDSNSDNRQWMFLLAKKKSFIF